MSWETGTQLVQKTSDINSRVAKLEGYIEEKQAKLLLYDFLKENISFASNLLLGIDLYPFQHLMIKGMMKRDYSLAICSRGLGKTFLAAVYVLLEALFTPGIHIGILSRSFRQAKMVMHKAEEIIEKEKAELFRQCSGKISRRNDEWAIDVGSSKITAVPLGDGEKLRGFRFQRVVVDELLLMPEKILNEVIMPFLSIPPNPMERQKLFDMESKMIASGKMKEEDRFKWPNNKLIGLSSASYKFENLYKLYTQYENMILADPETKDKKDKSGRVIFHFAYEMAPSQLYDKTLVNHAKATMSEAQFNREFMSMFTDDSGGYFKISKMQAVTCPDGEPQMTEIIGDPNAKYVLSFDPSWSESDASDDFAMHVIKIDEEKRRGTLVHSYAMPGTSLKKHIRYFLYLIENFNIVMMCGDYNGGVQFLQSVNESSLFKDKNINIGVLDIDIEDPTKYAANIGELKNKYNLTQKKICFLRKPTTQWIRMANEKLQAAFDHKTLWFAGAPLDSEFVRQRDTVVPVEELEFLRPNDDFGPDTREGKIVDFIENQKEMIDLTKTECALIELSSTAQGTQSFDLPQGLKRQSGPNRARKDSYSALVLANWIMEVYFDMQKAPNARTQTFAPRFIR